MFFILNWIWIEDGHEKIVLFCEYKTELFWCQTASYKNLKIWGWRIGLVVKSTECFSSDPAFNSQQPLGSPQPSIVGSDAFFCHKGIHVGRVLIFINLRKKRYFWQAMWYTAATPAPGTWKQEIKHLKARHYKPCQKPMTRRESTGHSWNTLSCQTSSCQSAFYIFMLIPIGVRCSQLWSEKLLSAVGNDYCRDSCLVQFQVDLTTSAQLEWSPLTSPSKALRRTGERR